VPACAKILILLIKFKKKKFLRSSAFSTVKIPIRTVLPGQPADLKIKEKFVRDPSGAFPV
jgi:hypothetical protein